MRPDRLLRRAVPACVAAAALVAAAGCGVSETPRPERIGDGIDVAAEARNSGAQPLEVERGASRNIRETVEHYISQAAYGGQDAIRRSKSYMTAEAAAAFRPAPTTPPKVVHILEWNVPPDKGERDKSATVKYQVMGYVEPTKGWFVPENGRTLDVAQFESHFEDQQWRLSKVPPALLLTDVDLATYYRNRPVYFWDKTQRFLVPDLRYLPNTSPADLRANQVMDWLIGAPSPRLSTVVQPLQGIERSGTISTTKDGTWVVKLSGAAASLDNTALQRLTEQLRWSLRDLAGPPNYLELTVENQPRAVDGTSDSYRSFNATEALPDHEDAYLVVSGRLVRRDAPGEPISALGNQNSKIVSAAVSADGARVAVIRDGRLVIGGAARSVSLPPGPVSRPAWIPGTDHVLVAAGGRLRAYDSNGQAIAVNAGLPDNVTAFAVAPDGHRIAVVAGGRAYVASLDDGPPISVESIAQLANGMLSQNTAIAWTGEAEVLIAGAARGAPAMVLASADGAIVRGINVDAHAPITDAVAYPRKNGALTVALILGGNQVWEYYTPAGNIEPLTVDGQTQTTTSVCYAS